ncbi:MAG: hypothetical protein DME50_03810 [Verrucomicrobia bacterium]|nr:MAG: hypothetical protein DME50_03810 [Verrucomicrobiota bacterium]
MIDSYAGHPAEQPVRAIIPSLLLDWRGGKCAAGDIKLIPANSHWTAAACGGIDRVIRPQRFGAIEIVVYNWRHYFVPQGIELLCCSQLRHEKSVQTNIECVSKSVDRNFGIRSMVGEDAKSGIRWRDKIDMKEPSVDLGQGHAPAARAING